MGHLHARADGNYPDHLHAWLHDPLLGAGTLLERGIPGLEILYFRCCLLPGALYCLRLGPGARVPGHAGRPDWPRHCGLGRENGLLRAKGRMGLRRPCQMGRNVVRHRKPEYQHTFPGAHEPVHGLAALRHHLRPAGYFAYSRTRPQGLADGTENHLQQHSWLCRHQRRHNLPLSARHIFHPGSPDYHSAA